MASSTAYWTQEDQERSRAAFLRFDKDRNGTIDAHELRAALEGFGQRPSDEEIFIMIAEVDVDANGVVDFSEFVRVLQAQKERAAALSSESDMVDAFIACGGQPDKSGFVERDRLVRIVKEDFGLMIDIEALISKYDADATGEMEYAKFKALLTGTEPV